MKPEEEMIKPVLEAALKLFQNQEKANHWLNKPIPLLGGLPPLEYCTDLERQREVLDLIERFEHGMLS